MSALLYNADMEQFLSSFKRMALLTSLFSIVGYSGEGGQPDSGFKGIHQLDYEIHQRNTVPSDTGLGKEYVEVRDVGLPDRQVETIINRRIFNVLLITLLIVLVIFLILHRRYRLRRE
jgi:hypothetical protein